MVFLSPTTKLTLSECKLLVLRCATCHDAVNRSVGYVFLTVQHTQPQAKGKLSLLLLLAFFLQNNPSLSCQKEE